MTQARTYDNVGAGRICVLLVSIGVENARGTENMNHTITGLILVATIFISGCSVIDAVGDTLVDAYDGAREKLSPPPPVNYSAIDAKENPQRPNRLSDCEVRTDQQLKAASFVNAAPIELVVRHGEYSPMIIRMHVGQTYVFRLRNRDPVLRSFNAPEFFDSIAVSVAAIDNDILATRCLGPVVSLKPGQSFEMKFIAVTDGRYEYRDKGRDFFDYNRILNNVPPGGIIRIEERY